MIGTVLGSVLALFFVMTTPAMVTQNTSFPYLARNLAAAIFMTVILLVAPWNFPLTLFLTGAAVCGVTAMFDRREGVKMLLLEPVVIVALIVGVVIFKEDAGGMFSGRGLAPTLMHVEGTLYKHGIPLRTEHFGLFSTGGLAGILASVPLRARLISKAKALLNRYKLKQRRALPEAAVFGDRLFAPWRMFQRGQRRLSARINRVTLR